MNETTKTEPCPCGCGGTWIHGVRKDGKPKKGGKLDCRRETCEGCEHYGNARCHVLTIEARAYG